MPLHAGQLANEFREGAPIGLSLYVAFEIAPHYHIWLMTGQVGGGQEAAGAVLSTVPTSASGGNLRQRNGLMRVRRRGSGPAPAGDAKVARQLSINFSARVA
jgi:hypothetical protein